MLAIAAAIVGAIVYVRTRPAEPMLIASVDQVVLRQADYAGKTMRVQGELVAGTIERGGEPCVLRFTLERKHLRLPVRLAGCVVPALFRDTDGLMIVAEGELRADQGFEARQILVPTPAFSEMR